MVNAEQLKAALEELKVSFKDAINELRVELVGKLEVFQLKISKIDLHSTQANTVVENN